MSSSSSNKDENTSSTPFSIQNILGNKNYDGVWTTILSSRPRPLDSPEGSSTSHHNMFKATDWDAEAIDMRMKHQLKGEKF